MKKIVVVIILAVFVASVAIVNFFGLEIKQYDGETYIGSIEVSDMLFLGDNNTSLTPQLMADGSLYYVFDYIPPEVGTEYSKDDPLNRNMVRLDFIIVSEDGKTLPYDDGKIDYV